MMFQKTARSVEARAEEADVGRTKLYQEIRAGRLKARKIGRRTVIIDSDWQEYLANLPLAGA